jgi:hypothetical protein
MATAARHPGPSAAATFSVQELAVRDGVVRVRGRWSGIRGLRFLRPTLIVGGTQVLATLEHKPWAPREDRAWVAAFRWDGDPADLERASLEVAPSVVVPLGRGAVAPRVSVAGTTRRREPVAAPEQAAVTPPPAVPEPRVQQRAPERRPEPPPERPRDDRIAAARRVRDEQLRAAERAVRQLTAERDEARSQRDEVLLAHRSLEQVLARERADRDRETLAPAEPEPEQPTPDALPPLAEREDEVPLGVRAVPAARAVPADLLRARAEDRAQLGSFDRWALRVLAVAAASCFVLLLVLLLSVFV